MKLVNLITLLIMSMALSQAAEAACKAKTRRCRQTCAKADRQARKAADMYRPMRQLAALDMARSATW